MQKKPENESFSLKQRKLFRGKHIFTVIEDKIEYCHKGIFSLNTFTILLRELNPEPSRHQNVSVGWLLWLIVLLLFDIGDIALIFTAMRLNEKDAVTGGTMILLVLCVFTFFAAKKTFDNLVNVWMFNGQDGYLSIWANSPNKKEVEKFVTALSEKIKQYQGENKRERDFLDFLKNEGLIDEWNYDKAAKLLENRNS